MSPTADPIPRAKKPWSWLAGILVLGTLTGALVAAAVLLWEYVDVRAITRSPGVAVAGPLPEPSAPSAGAVLASRGPVRLYHSARSAGFFPDTSHYAAILTRWEGVASESGYQASLIRTAEEVAELEGVGVVLAPAAICLDAAEVEAFERHVDLGGGLLLTWATGARDADCEWRGWEVVRDLTGTDEVRQLDEREGVYLTIPGGGPLAYGIEPVARVELRWDAQVAVSSDGPRLFWSDWAFNPAPAHGEEAIDAGVHMRETSSGGRVLWYGFNGGEAVGPLDERRVGALFRNGLAWAAGVPAADLQSWPGGRQAALAVTQQVGWEFENAGHLAALGGELGVPVSFFVASRMALDHPELAEILLQAGELGTRGPDDQSFGGLPTVDQRVRLERSLTQVRGWSGTSPAGFRPPEEGYDAETLAAWASLGGTYLVALNNGRTGSPEVHETADGSVVLLPRVVKDDYNILIQDRALRGDALSLEFAEGIRKIGVLGGLALMTTHSQLAGKARWMPSLRRVLEDVIAAEGWWMATTGEVAGWTLARQGASVSLHFLEDDAIEVRVRAHAERGLEGAWVDLSLPRAEEWEPTVRGVPVGFALTRWGMAIQVDDLPSGGEWRAVVSHMESGALGS
jgi:peptidoglycan/xylan/chitin deacetylase (PgdA/CDA1 family)